MSRTKAMNDAVEWILRDAAYKAPEQIGDIAERWLDRLRAIPLEAAPAHPEQPKESATQGPNPTVDDGAQARAETVPAFADPSQPSAALDAESLARMFHAAYEEMAPTFGYETRGDTREFDTTAPNGMLMISVCQRILSALRAQPPVEGRRECDNYAGTLNADFCVNCGKPLYAHSAAEIARLATPVAPRVEQPDDTLILEGGKYEFYLKDHVVMCRRYGEDWRQFGGDKAIYCLLTYALELRARLSGETKA